MAGNPCTSVQRSLYEVGEWRENRGKVVVHPSMFSELTSRIMGAGFLLELLDSVGQKLLSSGQETGVSAHPDGKQQVSQTGKMF